LGSGTFEAKASSDDATDRSAPDTLPRPDAPESIGISHAHAHVHSVTVADSISEAHDLAQRIEELLTPRSGEAEPYGVRLARALAQSLIDQLADLSRDSKRSKSV
jgi:hypothetical protein